MPLHAARLRGYVAMRTCKVSHCNRDFMANGYCKYHDRVAHQGKDPEQCYPGKMRPRRAVNVVLEEGGKPIKSVFKDGIDPEIRALAHRRWK